MSIVVVGSVAVDNIKTPAGEAKGVFGGSSVYFSMAARYFGPVSLISVVGADFPEAFRRQLADARINTDGLLETEGETFTWTGSYNANLDAATTHYVAANVLANFTPKIPANSLRPDFLFLANIDPGVQSYVLDRVRPRFVAGMDTMNLWIETQRKEVLKVMRRVDIMILNDSEARMLSGESHLPGAAKAIAALGPKRVIIKKGEHGALMYSPANGYFVIPAFIQEKLVDTTGAGDSFAGGFIGLLQSRVKKGKVKLTEKDFRQAVIYGNVMASFTVEDFSVSRLAKLKAKNIEDRFKKILQLINVSG